MTRRTVFGALIAAAASPFVRHDPARAAAAAATSDAYAFTFEGFDGKPLPLAAYRGKVLLVVNTATECGFTPQLEGLEALWTKWEKAGLVVVGVPSNDFGGQEPRKGAEIAEYCKMNYGVTFPLADRTPVSGKDAHPFYKWAYAVTGSAPMWNFHKYLVGRDGHLIAAYGSMTTPNSTKLTSAIEAALATSVPTQ
ncbi:MAG: glutathione peroxidase [Hyphomicrobiales bacterium]